VPEEEQPAEDTEEGDQPANSDSPSPIKSKA
jgi:hypothetical protein